MFNYEKICNHIFYCSNCNIEYKCPYYIDEKTGDKIYDYEIINYDCIQTQCPHCNEYNYMELKKR